jgi:phosphatidylglycerol:prolipoprotein diacylglycerol transferase
MWFLNINPVLFHLGSFEIRYYGIIYALGFVIAYFMIPWVAKKLNVKKLQDKDVAADLVLYLIVGGVLGARLFHVLFYNSVYYFAHPLEILMIWQGGVSFHGGLVGAIIAVYLFCRKNKIKFYDVADICVVPYAFALFLGRIGNFINGELVGKVSNVSWCVVFPDYQGCRHPTQLYESLKNLLVFGVLILIVNFKKRKPGLLFWSFAGIYGVLRFFIEFLKEADFYFLGLNTGQLFCLPMIVLSAVFLIKINKK